MVDGDVNDWYDRYDGIRFGVFGNNTSKVVLLFPYRQFPHLHCSRV